MPTSNKGQSWSALLAILTVSVLVELFLLRTTTRTLIHIPGIGDLETPIRTAAELGRFAYYLAIVSLIVTLASLGIRLIRSRVARQVAGGLATVAFLVVAAAARLGAMSAPLVGWITLVLLLVVTAAGWRGLSSVPVGLFVLGSVAAGWSAVGQTSGGGLSGGQVDTLIVTAECLLVAAGASSPLMLARPPSRSALIAGVTAAGLVTAAFAGGASTFSILVLWNLGVPGWLPGVAFALAFGGMVTTLWSASASRERQTAIGVWLLLAGGVGLISTYQTGLVLAAVVLLGYPALTLESRAATAGIPVDREARHERVVAGGVAPVP
jgi:hypothetical protein